MIALCGVVGGGFWSYALGFCMANGQGPVLGLQGKVEASNRLVIVVQAVSGTPKGGSPVANLVGSVNASGALVCTQG